LHATHDPSQAESQQTPSVQNPDAQSALLVQATLFLVLQLPVPSQAFPASQLPATSVPALANTQVPADPATLHDLQAPVHAAASQQTPSTQNPLAHWLAVAAVHPSPLPHPVTLYSQVSAGLFTPYMPESPPKNTTTPRMLSNTMLAP
jgi:hypothetical protein